MGGRDDGGPCVTGTYRVRAGEPTAWSRNLANGAQVDASVIRHDRADREAGGDILAGACSDEHPDRRGLLDERARIRPRGRRVTGRGGVVDVDLAAPYLARVTGRSRLRGMCTAEAHRGTGQVSSSARRLRPCAGVSTRTRNSHGDSPRGSWRTETRERGAAVASSVRAGCSRGGRLARRLTCPRASDRLPHRRRGRRGPVRPASSSRP